MASPISLHPNKQSSKELKPSPKQTTIDLVGGIRCNICLSTFASKKDYDTHYASHPNVTEIIYTCNICYKEIVGYPSFRGHCYTNHVIRDRFKCEHCSKQFSKIAVLNDHINIVHKFKCSMCSEEFPSKKEMLLHQQIIHSDSDKPPYKCQICKIDIDTLTECKEHIELHLRFLYSCPVCNENISDKANASNHMKQHFDEPLSDDEVFEKEVTKPSEETFIEQVGGIFCELCSAVLKNRVEFDAHFSCEHGDEDIVYMCVVCGKTFEKYSIFYNHCYNHSVKNRYECAICQKSFPRPSMLAMHTVACQQAGATNGKPFACTVCDHRFACEDRWREHLRQQHAITRIPCTHRGCDLTFDTPKQLIIHQQSHDVTIRHYCYQCRLLFTSVAACVRHMDVHRKKIYNCPVCKRNYWEKNLVLKHVSQHFETVLHICKLCGRLYNSKGRLVEHMKSHSNVKNHSCKYCDKTFTKLLNLEQHMNTHTGSRPYKCPVCEKTFASYPNWRKHIRRMHTDDNINLKNPLIDRTEGLDEENSVMETVVDEEDEMSTDMTDDALMNTDEQISIDSQNCNTNTIENTINHSDSADCLSDIDHANASIDFANVKLENYIFSVANDDNIEVDNILPIPVEKDLFNENNSGNIPIGKDLLVENSEENAQIGSNLFQGSSGGSTPIGSHSFNGNSGENNPIGTHLYNGNRREGTPICTVMYNGNRVENAPISREVFNGNKEENVPGGKGLYNGNSEENDNPFDILEYIAEMPENNSMFVPVIPQEQLAPSCGEAAGEAASFPREYGPEFASAFDTTAGFVDLDDHMLPHIDPLLTIKDETCNKMYVQMQNNQYNDYNVTVETTDYENLPKWEPPIITKLYDEYAYGYGEMTDANRLSIMNTDIF